MLGTAPDIEIAKRIGRTRAAVFQRRHTLGIAPAPTELRRSTSLDQAQVDAIRDQYGAGATQYDLAAQYGVAQPTISRIVQRKERRGRSDIGLPQTMPSIDWSRASTRLGIDPNEAIARDLGCSGAAVRARLKTMGIDAPDSTPGPRRRR